MTDDTEAIRDNDFQGIITKLRTTRGSAYALDVMREAADRIESDSVTIARLSALIDTANGYIAECIEEMVNLDPWSPELYALQARSNLLSSPDPKENPDA